MSRGRGRGACVSLRTRNSPRPRPRPAAGLRARRAPLRRSASVYSCRAGGRRRGGAGAPANSHPAGPGGGPAAESRAAGRTAPGRRPASPPTCNCPRPAWAPDRFTHVQVPVPALLAHGPRPTQSPSRSLGFVLGGDRGDRSRSGKASLGGRWTQAVRTRADSPGRTCSGRARGHREDPCAPRVAQRTVTVPGCARESAPWRAERGAGRGATGALSIATRGSSKEPRRARWGWGAPACLGSGTRRTELVLEQLRSPAPAPAPVSLWARESNVAPAALGAASIEVVGVLLA